MELAHGHDGAAHNEMLMRWGERMCCALRGGPVTGGWSVWA